MNIEDLKGYILNRLKNELSPKLTYHSLEHTNDVLNAANLIAKEESVSSYENDLISTAALFHDAGFIYQVNEHEERSCEIAKEILPSYNYTVEEIEIICGMIMATKIPQSPKNKLEEIICDADLDYLGRDDYWTIAENLYKEFLFLKIVESDEQWQKIQESFLSKHNYFTEFSLKNRNPQKQENFKKLISKTIN